MTSCAVRVDDILGRFYVCYVFRIKFPRILSFISWIRQVLYELALNSIDVMFDIYFAYVGSSRVCFCCVSCIVCCMCCCNTDRKCPSQVCLLGFIRHFNNVFFAYWFRSKRRLYIQFVEYIQYSVFPWYDSKIGLLIALCSSYIVQKREWKWIQIINTRISEANELYWLRVKTRNIIQF